MIYLYFLSCWWGSYLLTLGPSLFPYEGRCRIFFPPNGVGWSPGSPLDGAGVGEGVGSVGEGVGAGVGDGVGRQVGDGRPVV